MSKNGGEALVVILDGYFGLRLAPTVDELLHPLQILTALAVELTGFANDDTLNRLPCNIVAEIVLQFMGRNSCQPASNQLQRIGNC